MNESTFKTLMLNLGFRATTFQEVAAWGAGFRGLRYEKGNTIVYYGMATYRHVELGKMIGVHNRGGFEEFGFDDVGRQEVIEFLQSIDKPKRVTVTFDVMVTPETRVTVSQLGARVFGAVRRITNPNRTDEGITHIITPVNVKESGGSNE